MIIASHLHSLWEADLLPFNDDERLQLSHMAFSESDAAVSYLFKVVAGPSSRNFAFKRALAAGVPVHVVARAEELDRELKESSTDMDAQGGWIPTVLNAIHADDAQLAIDLLELFQPSSQTE
jgi:DNA mismatch repair ATPase MutS